MKNKNKKLTDKIIRAADYLPTPEQTENDSPDSFQMTRSDTVVFGIFGDAPDYSKGKYDRLWKKFHKSEDENTIAYCLEKGVDVMGEDGEPVPGWRDIAVMLKAIEKGWLKLNIKNDKDDEDSDEGLLDTEVEHYG